MNMKRWILGAVVGLASIAQAAAVTIDFDNTPGGGTLADLDVIAGQYSSLGVTFTGFENDQEVDIYVGNYWGSSPGGGNYLTNYTPATIQCCGVDRRDIVSIMFDSATSGISFDYLNTWAVAITMDIFDTGGGLLGSVGVAAGSTWDAVDLTAFSGVGRIDILQGGDGYTWGMDNLTFTSAVPETGTLALLALGLIGVSFAKRKKA